MATTRKTPAKSAKTTKTSTSASKASSMTNAAKSALSKSAPSDTPAPTPTTPVVVGAPQPVVAGPRMRKPELIDAVVARTGMKKKAVKPIIESTLAILGSALQDGRELNLEPMGKVKINREKKLASGKVLYVKIRQPKDLPSEIAKPDPKDMDDEVAPPTAAE
jgi:DNA-binding protein